MGWNSYFDAPLLQQLIFAQGMPAANVVNNYTYLDTLPSAVATHDVDVGNALSYQLATACGPWTADPNDFSRVYWRLVWYADQARTIIRDFRTYYAYSQSNGLILRGQCITPYVRITVGNNLGPSYNQNFRTDLSTYTREIAPLIFRNVDASALALWNTAAMPENGSINQGYFVKITQLLAPVTPTNWFPDFKVGNTKFTVQVSSTIAATKYIICDVISSGSNLPVSRIILPPGDSNQSPPRETTFYMPNEPCYVQLNNRDGVNSYQVDVQITQDYIDHS